MMQCFVMQPFDGGKFDKRYVDEIEPAILAADLVPYRVDRDPSVIIPIDSIQNEIRKSKICVAEITANNPNVWFELGFALALGKPTILLCDPDREKLPFDVQHRHVIKYTTDSTQDFARLRGRLTEKLKALLKQSEELLDLSDLEPLSVNEGLSPHEVAALVIVSQNLSTDDQFESRHAIHEGMRASGFTDIAVTLALRSLVEKGLVESLLIEDGFRDEYPAFKTTRAGFSWLKSNTSAFLLSKPRRESPLTGEVPF